MSETTEKTVSLDAARVFRAHTCVGLVSDDASVSWPSPVKVIGDDGRRLGWASLSYEKGEIHAHICIDYQTPERLSAETGSQRLYPRMVGYRGSAITAPWHVFPGELADGEFFIDALRFMSQPGFESQPALGEAILL